MSSRDFPESIMVIRVRKDLTLQNNSFFGCPNLQEDPRTIEIGRNVVQTTRKNREEKEQIRFSNDMKNACRTLCLVCHSSVQLTAFRGHTRRHHKITIEDYTKQYGNPKDSILEKIYHRCGLCARAILLNSDDIAFHLRKFHKISHKEYNAIYIISKKKQIKGELNCQKEPATFGIIKEPEASLTDRIRSLKKKNIDDISTKDLLSLIDEVLTS